jgi:protein-S-isoprenylcysteine O-methyltransferase Ste14
MAGRGHDKARVLELVMRGAVHKTTIVPHHHPATPITTGVYRVSRNPMYTGLAVAVAGASLVAVRRLVINPEER